MITSTHHGFPVSSDIRWVREYLDPVIPYRSLGRTRKTGLDCWGLIRLVYNDQFGILLPSYSGDYMDSEEREEIAGLIGQEESKWQRVDDPRVGDLLLFWIRSHIPSHVGMWIAPHTMLHVRRGASVCRERINTNFWSPRLVSIHRYGL